MDGCVLSLTLKRLRRLLTIRLRSEEDECRFYIYNEARHSVPGLYLLDKSEFYLSLELPSDFESKGCKPAFNILSIVCHQIVRLVYSLYEYSCG